MSPKEQTEAIIELQEQLNRLAEYVGIPEQQLKNGTPGPTLAEKSDFDRELEKARIEMVSSGIVEAEKVLDQLEDKDPVAGI